jgi:hypothetical protein
MTTKEEGLGIDLPCHIPLWNPIGSALAKKKEAGGATFNMAFH